MGKGEIARNKQFFLFPHCFLTFWITFSQLYQIWNCRLQTLVVWERVKMMRFLWIKHVKALLFIKPQVQIQSICRCQNRNGSRIEISVGKGRKCYVKRRKCCLPVFSFSPQFFLKTFFLRVIKTSDLNSVAHNPDFKRPWRKSLLKTLWEKMKMMETSRTNFDVGSPLISRLQMLSIWTSLKFCRLVKS